MRKIVPAADNSPHQRGELWTLQDKNVKVEELLQKSGNETGVVWLILRDAEASLKGTLPVVAGLFLIHYRTHF